jgi:glycosyltransferase involved in cell wall biosynthesis
MLGPIAARRPFVAGHYAIERCKLPAEWAIERRFAGRATRYISNCNAVRNWFLQHEVAVDKSIVIPAGIEPARSSDVPRDELLRRLSLPPDALLIGVIGRLIPENRVKDLIWAADLLRVLHNNLRVLVIGDGPLRAQLEEYARLASDLEHIRFLGAGNDVWRIMPHLSVLWNASENTGQSASILEAMAAGVPVIASDTPANRELIVDNDCGFLIPLGTRAGRAARARQTDRIFTNPELAARVAKNAQARIANTFSADRSLQEHLQLYDSA